MQKKEFTVGVVGAGVMGVGLVQLLVVSPNIKQIYWCSARKNNLDEVRADLLSRVSLLAKKGRIESQVAIDAEAKLLVVNNFEKLSSSDFIHEVVSESLHIKRDILTELSHIKNSDAIVASNTSSISITELAMSLQDPSKFIGMHFFNPAPLMKLVEIVSGYFTSVDTITKTKEYAESLGKISVEVADSPGFIVNRMLMPMINEAVCILAENIADRDCIDKAMKFGANHPIGPLALSDMIGNDVVLSIMQVLYEETGDQKYRPHPLLKKIVRAGRLGKKASAGFYDY